MSEVLTEPPYFSREEHDRRRAEVRARMDAPGLDALLAGVDALHPLSPR